ncbi:secretion protein, partial [Flavobacterium sp.]|uniref:secretion protein n=1 Tax=Flavobacterium sp. TaxID=239 RepID=UPI00391DADF8
MRKLLFVYMFVLSVNLQAQLYVSNNSYVFNRNSYVYVTGAVELNGTNSNFYLRNQGQLLQGTTGTSANRGTGRLSVFQEGTVNNFAYNYWCSPVGNASATPGNEPFGITMLHVPTTNIASTPAIVSASFNGVSSAGSMAIASYWIWRFLSSTNYSQWVHSQANTDIQAGEGFTMKGTSGSDATNVGEPVVNNPGSAQRCDFRGKPNDGNITINVGLNRFTLTGNPYSSAIDLNSFLTDPLNNAIDGTALFWEQDKTVNSHNIAQYRGGYGVYNGSTSVYTPATFYTYDLAGNQGSVFSNPNNVYQRRFSPIGQGFMVRGAANGTVQMRNSYRLFRREGVANNSQFERNSNAVQAADHGFFDDIPNVAGIDYTQISKSPTPHFIVNTSLNNQAVRQIAVCFLPTAIDGVDLADSKFPAAEADIIADMYLVLNNELYVHSTTSFDENKRFPIGFKNATNGLFTFTIKV